MSNLDASYIRRQIQTAPLPEIGLGTGDEQGTEIDFIACQCQRCQRTVPKISNRCCAEEKMWLKRG